MPKTNNRNLTLIRDGENVLINVSYDAVFSVFERHLVGLGLRFVEIIHVIGVDPPGATTGTTLGRFPFTILDEVTDGTVPQTISRSVSMPMSRTALDEDSSPILNPDVDPDEIRCKIQIGAVGLPPAITRDAFTNQEVLGFINQATTTAEA